VWWSFPLSSAVATILAVLYYKYGAGDRHTGERAAGLPKAPDTHQGREAVTFSSFTAHHCCWFPFSIGC